MPELYLSLETACIRCFETLKWLKSEHNLDVREIVEERWFPTYDGLVEVEDGEVTASHRSPNAIVRTLHRYGLAPAELAQRNLSAEFLTALYAAGVQDQ